MLLFSDELCAYVFLLAYVFVLHLMFTAGIFLSLSLSLSQSAWLVAIVALARSFFAVRPHNDEIRSQCPKRSGKGIHFLNCEKTLFSLLGI